MSHPNHADPLYVCCWQFSGVTLAFGDVGRVPLFFYLVHLPLIHFSSRIAARILYGAHPQAGVSLPAGYEPSLLRVYLMWALTIVVMYPLCRWYADYKSGHRHYWWCSYL